MKVEKKWIVTDNAGIVTAYPIPDEEGHAEPALLVTGQPGDVRERAEEISRQIVQSGTFGYSILVDALTAEHALAVRDVAEMVKWAYNEAWLKAFTNNDIGANWFDDWQASTARKRLEAPHDE